MQSRITIIVLLVLSCLLGHSRGNAQGLYFPPSGSSTWESVSPSSLGWNTGYIDTLRSFLEQKNTRAFVLLKDGRIAIEMYFGTFTKDSAWYWASAGKSLTSVLVGIAQQEGFLSLQDTTSRWIGKGWTTSAPAKEDLITIRHQLTMTTGLDDAVADPYCTDPGCLVYRADAGTRWAYHNAPYTLLDSVMRSATGSTLNAWFSSRVGVKTGMTGLFFRQGYNNVFYSTARSMARFGLLMLNRGSWGATPVLTDTAYVRAMTSSSQQLNPSYGYLWWLNGKPSYMLPQSQLKFPGPLNPSAPSDMFAALGKNGQFIDIVPGQNLVFVRTGDAPDNSQVPFTLNDEIWQKLNLIIPRTDPTDVAADADVPDRIVVQQNYPNPFNPVTTIRYAMPNSGHLLLTVHDLLGREIARLVDGPMTQGEHAVEWDATGLCSGIYFYRLRSGDHTTTRSMTVLR
jgi:CubicO group peptidase (beta-lactamase class C family)